MVILIYKTKPSAGKTKQQQNPLCNEADKQGKAQKSWYTVPWIYDGKGMTGGHRQCKDVPALDWKASY